MVTDMISFLKGETKTVENKLSKQMDYFTSKMMYEDSARVRDQLKAINSFKVGQRKLEEIESCRPFLETQLEIIKPRVIITLGNFSTRLLLNTKIGITKLRGEVYEYLGCTLIPTFHPAAALRGRVGVIENMRTDLRKAKEIING